MEVVNEVLVTGLLLAIAGVADAMRDLSEEHNKGIPRSWWKGESWKNKWKRVWVQKMAGEKYELVVNRDRLWYYLWLYRPPYKERFPYSSTFLVWTTDIFHLSKTVFHLCIYSVLVICFGLWGIIPILAWRLGFFITHSSIRKTL